MNKIYYIVFSVSFLSACASSPDLHTPAPPNSEPDPYANQGWSCKSGYIQTDKGCEDASIINAINAHKLIIQEEKIAEQQRRADLEEKERRLRAEERKQEQQKIDAIQTALRETRRTQELKLVTKFRNSLQVEAETNCGPVLEIKKELIKVYYPVRDYGNEHWLRRYELYPAGAGYSCQFINGQYIDPGLIN